MTPAEIAALNNNNKNCRLFKFFFKDKQKEPKRFFKFEVNQLIFGRAGKFKTNIKY